jgi:hypothetical protein
VTDQLAVVGIEDVTLEAVVLRAVPCAAHDTYEADCPDCLTGEQARELGVVQEIENRGIVSRLLRHWVGP